jgi:hypothetical protein
LPRTAQRRDMDRLAVSVADAAFDARLAERRHYVVLARPLLLAGYIIGTLESRFLKRHALGHKLGRFRERLVHVDRGVG